MLRNIKDLEGYAVGAADGSIGHVKDFYFDDQAWVVRYIVVDAGAWLSSRKVLISPIAVDRPERAERLLHVSITKEQVKNSPDIDTERPVSRQHEIQYAGYWGGGMYPNLMMPGYGGFGSPNAIRSEDHEAYARAESARSESENPHLRSCQAVMKYHLHASDGDLGHVEGMLVDDETWAVRYLIVNTSNWWLGHQVLIAPQWIDDVNWYDSKVSVKMTRRAIKGAPAYQPATPLDRAQESGLYAHYGSAGYWTDAPRRETEISRI